jgi:osmoprotectant transport system ATP-binding protein
MIELRGASVTYGSAVALRPTDLTVEPGRTTVLIGPSGCGKSTLLRVIAGLIRPRTGQVWLEREELRPENVMLLRRRMGYVIQEGGLFAHLTAGGNAALMAHYLRWRDQRISERLAGLAQLTRLPLELLERYPAELSGGQRQRVSLMRALMLDPDLLLLDEPLGALDPMVRFELQEDLKQIFLELKKTVVLVTHDIAEAAFFADSIVLMRDGAIVQRGTVRDLLDHPADPFVTRFVNARRALPELAGRRE